MRPFRLAVVNSHPIQYFAPLFRYINADPRFEVTVLYLSDHSLRGAQDVGFGQTVTWDIDLLSGYRSVFVGEAAKRRTPAGFFSLIAPQVWNEVRSGGYDALLVHGHAYAANLIAVAAAKSKGLPVFSRGETHLGLVREGAKRWIRKPVMGAFYALFDRFLAIGSANRAFYAAMGVPARKIFLTPYSVDNSRFVNQSTLTPAERSQWRARFGIPEDGPAILYAAKFTRRKHPDDLLSAAAKVRKEFGAPFYVVMCGAGEMEAELKAYCVSHGLNNVIFTGFVNQGDLPKLYGACDVFVLPSENEPWGLAVNEAMCAGLPIVIAREVGCVADLVTDGVNGFTPQAKDVHGLASALKQLIEDDALRRRQGAASRDRISHWSYRQYLEGLAAAVTDLPRRGRMAASPRTSG
jgi:glycosyltransferase involved in cell wall biosynthesis